MFYQKVRCICCKSSNLVEHYEGSMLTCTKCGTVGQIEPIPSVYSLESLEECLETDEELRHKNMEAFAKEIIGNMDVSDLLCSLKVRKLRHRTRRLNEQMLDKTVYCPVKRKSLKLCRRLCFVYRYKPY